MLHQKRDKPAIETFMRHVYEPKTKHVVDFIVTSALKYGLSLDTAGVQCQIDLWDTFIKNARLDTNHVILQKQAVSLEPLHIPCHSHLNGV